MPPILARERVILANAIERVTSINVNVFAPFSGSKFHPDVAKCKKWWHALRKMSIRNLNDSFVLHATCYNSVS